VGVARAIASPRRCATARDVLLWWACQWLGAVFVPLNWRLRTDEVVYCVTDAGAVAVALEDASAAWAPRCRAALPASASRGAR
jgi:2-furoate---CoA ligase